MLIPAIDIPIPTELGASDGSKVIDFIHQLGILGPVLLRLFNTNGEVFEKFIAELVSYAAEKSAIHIDGLDVDNDDLATKLLDKGAHVVYFNWSAEKDLLRKVLQTLPKSRVGLSCIADVVSLEMMTSAIGEFGECAGHFFFQLPPLADTEAWKEMTAIRQQAKTLAAKGARINFMLPVGVTESDVTILASFNDNVNAVFYPKIVTTLPDKPVIKSPYPHNEKTIATANTLGLQDKIDLDYVSAFIGCLRSDRPDGVYTTVVCDDHDVCLGLVYSNEQSIRTAVSERRGVYWSRSRGGLWKKGETSGMFQELLAIRFDCDGDALRFSVIQRGDPPAFCHLMTRTCWGNVHGIQHLEEILVDRKKSAPVGSYTKRLFDDPDLLQKKLLEEVQELVEATDPDHIAAEAADVTYFMMTRCVAAGVSLRDIEKHLDKRTLKVTRRPGNAKAWRSENAAQILNGTTNTDTTTSGTKN